MANKALNQVSQVQSTELTNVKTFLAVMNNGEIKQMSKEDMAAVVGGLIGLATNKKNGLVSKNYALQQIGNYNAPYVLIYKSDNVQGLLRLLIFNGNLGIDRVYLVSIRADSVTVQALTSTKDFRVLWKQVGSGIEVYLAASSSSANMGAATLTRDVLLNTNGDMSDMEVVYDLDESGYTIVTPI